MKFIFCAICLLFAITQIEGQREPGCPDICPAIYQPVCAEASIRKNFMRCQFSNSCRLGSSSCRHNIKWWPTPLSKCNQTSADCSQFL